VDNLKAVSSIGPPAGPVIGVSPLFPAGPLPKPIHDYIEIWHNQRRRHSRLKMLTPTEFEDHHTTTITG